MDNKISVSGKRVEDLEKGGEESDQIVSLGKRCHWRNLFFCRKWKRRARGNELTQVLEQYHADSVRSRVWVLTLTFPTRLIKIVKRGELTVWRLRRKMFRLLRWRVPLIEPIVIQECSLIMELPRVGKSKFNV